MNLNEYQKEALSTAIYPNDGNPSYLSLGVCGEAGEVAEKVKKILRDKGGNIADDDRTAIALELGDVMWYIANFAKAIGFTLSEVAQMNIDKNKGRAERGTLHGTGDNR